MRKNITFYTFVVIYAFIIMGIGNSFVQTIKAKLTYSQFVVQVTAFKPAALVRKVPPHGTTQAMDITTISTVNIPDLRFIIDSGAFSIGKSSKQNETEPRSTSIRNPTKEFVTEKTKYTYHGQDLMALVSFRRGSYMSASFTCCRYILNDLRNATPAAMLIYCLNGIF